MGNGAMEFEKKFIELIKQELTQRCAENATSKKEIAERAYPDRAKPDNIWTEIFNNGKRINLEDVYRLCRAFELNVPDFIWRVWKELQTPKS